MRYLKKWLYLAVIISLVLFIPACSAETGAGATGKGTKTSQDKKSGSDTQGSDSDDEEYTEEELRSKEEEALISDTYLVEDLNSREERIILKSLSSGRRYRFAFGLATQFLDKWGNLTSQTDFVPGSIVRIGNAVNNVLSSISLCKDAWVVEDLTNFSYDKDREIFLIGNSKYRIRPSTGVFSGDLTVTMDDITAEDHLRVSGIDKEVLSVSVTTGHGYIALVNTDFFKNSMISIGSDIYTKITGDTVIPVSAGKYKVTVAKNGYGGSTDVKVSGNDTVTIDLNTLKGDGPKKCSIIFKTSIDGVKVRLDGKKVPVNKRFDVDYGQHKLKVSVPDYETWEKALIVNSPKSAISLDPEGYGKDAGVSADSNNNTDNKKNSRSAGNDARNSNSSNKNNRSSGGGYSSGSRSSSSGSGGSNSGYRNNSGSYNDYDDEDSSDGTNSTTERSGNYSGNRYGRDDDDYDDEGDLNVRSSSSNSNSDLADSATDDARQAELDYLDTLSNMITELTGED